MTLQGSTYNRCTWPSPRSWRPLTSEKFYLDLQSVGLDDWISIQDTPLKFNGWFTWKSFPGKGDLELGNHYFQVPAAKLWGCILSLSTSRSISSFFGVCRSIPPFLFASLSFTIPIYTSQCRVLLEAGLFVRRHNDPMIFSATVLQLVTIAP